MDDRGRRIDVNQRGIDIDTLARDRPPTERVLFFF